MKESWGVLRRRFLFWCPNKLGVRYKVPTLLFFLVSFSNAITIRLKEKLILPSIPNSIGHIVGQENGERHFPLKIPYLRGGGKRKMANDHT